MNMVALTKSLFTIVLLFSSFICVAQDTNSLLWKISGNGLEKDSYLYGTMHVSQKIAFHLDDVFYEALEKSDKIALETDPNLWLDFVFDNQDFHFYMNGYSVDGDKGFYNTPFLLKSPKREQIQSFLAQEHQILNGILYRSNKGADDFEEDTFLDMFIYQAGSKNKKPIVSLEDIEESTDLVNRASIDALKKKPEVWLQKLLKEDNYYTLLNNAYRDRRIYFLDSIQKGMYTEHHMKYMLYDRNKIMVKAMDSIMQKGSLFSGIGAAHLPGKEGVIHLLEEKGYTVSPLSSKKTTYGQTQKKAIEDRFITKKYTIQKSADGFFSAAYPSKLYETTIGNNVMYLCPDITNGAFITITRLQTFDYLKGEQRELTDLESILYESIPGEIISKEKIVKNGFEGFDIHNRTKNGNDQRYQIFLTPLELIIFKMGGKQDFVSKEGHHFFDAITFHKETTVPVTIQPTFKHFTVALPNSHTFINSDNIGARLVQAYDTKGNFFFLKEVALNDLDYIEEDAFELERIQKQFCENMDIPFTKGTFTQSQNRPSYSSWNAIPGKEQKIGLKTVIDGAKYYLLGAIVSNSMDANEFFNSFKVQPSVYKEPFIMEKDTSLYFSVRTIIEPPENYSFQYDLKKNKDKKYLSKSKQALYRTDANESVLVSFYKYHDYKNSDHIDSLWSRIIKRNAYRKRGEKTYNPRKYIVNVQKGEEMNQNPSLDYTIKDSLSTRAIMVKNILNGGVLYRLESLVDTIQGPSVFVENFFDTFAPKDTIIGRSLFEDKATDFMQALQKNDSLVFDSYNIVNFQQKDAKALLKLLKKFEFPEDKLHIKTALIQELGQLDGKNIDAYLKELYAESTKNSFDQIAIIKALITKKESKSYQDLLAFLQKDIPITDSRSDVSDMLWGLRDSLSLSKQLFPDLLEFTSVEEYKNPIYSLLAKLKDSSMVSKDLYKEYYPSILREGKIVLKRQRSKKYSDDSYNYSSYSDNTEQILNSCITLLMPFYKDPNVQDFYRQVSEMDASDVLVSYVAELLKNKQKVPKELRFKLASSLETRSDFYRMLKSMDRLDIFPKEYREQEALVRSALLQDSDYEVKKKDSIVFLEKRTFSITDKNYELFFYKTKKNHSDSYYEEDKDWKLHYMAVEKKEPDEISLKTYDYDTDQYIDETKTMDEVMDDVIEGMVLKYRKRVRIKNYDY